LTQNPALFTPDPVRYRTNTDRITKLITQMRIASKM